MARWNNCNILQLAPDAKRLWRFDAKGGGFVLGREQRISHTETLPAGSVAKSWATLWQPRLNVAWLPPESVFLRVVELPKSNFDETFSMVELQLEKLSPLPVAQTVWTMHILPEVPGDLQTVIVVIAARGIVEEFLGRLEKDGYLADRLEVPFLDQLEADGLARPGESAADAWVYPMTVAGQSGALIAWWFGGLLRNLSFITVPPAGERAEEVKKQLSMLNWSGELEGWLNSPPKWHLVTDPVSAFDWENILHEALGELVHVEAPPVPAELAGRTARRAAKASPRANLLPAEFTARYHQQFIDRLWLRGLMYAGVLYAALLAVYFAAVAFQGYRTHDVEQQVADISNDYTNAIQLKARAAVLKERQDLKYAALDCWKLVAERLPDGINLQRFSFADGKKLSLNGTCTQDQIGLISDPDRFYDGVRKARVDGQPVFDQDPGHVDQLVYRNIGGNQVTWNFGVQLLHVEEEQQP